MPTLSAEHFRKSHYENANPEAPKKERGGRKWRRTTGLLSQRFKPIKDSKPVKTAGLLNQRFMPNYHNQFFFLCLEVCFTWLHLLLCTLPKSQYDCTEMEGTTFDVYPRYILGSVSKSMSNEQARCLDVGKATGRLTDDWVGWWRHLEISIKKVASERTKTKHNVG